MEKASILVVEDESIVAIDITQTLESMGYRVVDAVPSGKEALLCLKDQDVDLVLLDIQLRGEMDGIQVAEHIQESFRIPFIFLSTYSDDLTLARAKLTEPYGYITKSFDQNDLHSTIEMALYRHLMELRIREKEELLSVTLKSINDGVITTDALGQIRFLNPSAEWMFAISADQVVGMAVDQIGISFWKEEVLVLPHHLEDGHGTVTGEFEMRNERTETSIPVECTITPLEDSRDRVTGYVYVVKDIREQMRIKEMQNRLVSIVESSEDAIIGATLEGTIDSWNSGAEKIFGYSLEEVRGKNLSMLVPDYYPNELPEHLDRLRGGKDLDHYETIRKNKAGETLDMSIKLSSIRDSAGKVHRVSLICRDITNQRHLEKQVLETTEWERERIGQDLHDSLGQLLTGLSLRLRVLKGKIEGNADAETEWEAISGVLKDAITQTRELARGFIPDTIKTEGLAQALGELAYHSQTLHRIPTVFNLEGNIQGADTLTETQLYHIAQEAVTNAHKHAQADHIVISLNQEGSDLSLKISDDGVGYVLPGESGLGLKIMEYRAKSISGQIGVFSSEGEGTTVLCRVPIKPEVV